MVLGAIVDAGVPLADLEREVRKIGVGGFSLTARRTRRGGVTGTLVSVDLDEDSPRGLGWQDFAGMIDGSALEPAVARRSRDVLRRLAEAEAAVHGTTIDDTRLHELGSLDTIVDVVGSVAGLELLQVERVYSSALPSGSGTVKSEHGPLPVPAPATAALLAMASAPVTPPPNGAVDAGEMVTPTGAAILTSLATFRQPSLTLERVGYGLGSRESTQYPNVLALWLGEETGMAYTNDNTLIETNVDDMGGNLMGYLHERLFKMGARDVWFTPIQMKKNRPGTMISAIVPSELESRAVDLIMRESSTLGVRVRPVARYEAERAVVEVDTSLGRVEVKVKRIGGRDVSVAPEYESCRRIALEKGLPLKDVYGVVQSEADQALL
jgi:uncharacterized protein (TIGR00299 family) protein